MLKIINEKLRLLYWKLLLSIESRAASNRHTPKVLTLKMALSSLALEEAKRKFLAK